MYGNLFKDPYYHPRSTLHPHLRNRHIRRKILLLEFISCFFYLIFHLSSSKIPSFFPGRILTWLYRFLAWFKTIIIFTTRLSLVNLLITLLLCSLQLHFWQVKFSLGSNFERYKYLFLLRSRFHQLNLLSFPLSGLSHYLLQWGLHFHKSLPGLPVHFHFILLSHEWIIQCRLAVWVSLQINPVNIHFPRAFLSCDY